MKAFFLGLFTWWNSATVGTRVHTWRKGNRVGEDDFGNVYYQGGQDSEGRTRRWVIYKGYAEASAIPPGWHGWMHHRTDVSPVDEDYVPYEWQLAHQPNLTGSAGAYRPKGSVTSQSKRPNVTGDYDAWKPGR